MNSSVYALIGLVAAVTGCASSTSVYHDLPLVSQVETGMSKERVMQVAGQPLSESARTDGAGTCLDYMLIKPGHQQAYSVSLDNAGEVEKKSFSTCAEAGHQSTRKALDNMGGVGGAGY